MERRRVLGRVERELMRNGIILGGDEAMGCVGVLHCVAGLPDADMVCEDV